MNSFIQMICGIFLLLLIPVNQSLAQDPDDIRDAYQEAKSKSRDFKWTEAIALFDDFLEKYPGSKYEDDAIFWIAYSLEKLPEKRQESFDTFSRLVNNHPNSAWADDAQIHQIGLAEQFVLEGQEVYKNYLYQQLENDHEDIQIQAAIALGRIGDKKALPVLEKMRDNEDYGGLARDLIAVISTGKEPIDDDEKSTDDHKKLDMIFDKNQVKPDEDALSGIMVFNTERYAQYRSMLRKDDEWTKEELMNFALWHIMDANDFKEYVFLENEYDKSEWRRKFWKRKDPTPTTSENEFEVEFQYRIDYARSKFASFWNYKNFKYLPDQHLRLGWPHAPWDARGELYIKYGEPDTRTIESWHEEIWTYYRYKVDFLVKQYMTNVFGNAIVAGELSNKNYGGSGGRNRDFDHLNPLSPSRSSSETLWNSVNTYVQANFIFNQEIRYIHDYNADPIEGLQLLFDKFTDKDIAMIVFRYQLPADELELVSQAGVLEVSYREVYCVLDEDLREVVKEEIVRRIENIPNDDFKFEESIPLNLPEGKYTLHLRIEDQNAENLGIFSQEFEVKDL